MKTLLALGALALLAGCVSYDPMADEKRMCQGAEKWGGNYAECVLKLHEAGLRAVPEPSPTVIVQQRTITCSTSRDFPGSRLLTSSTTTCE